MRLAQHNASSARRNPHGESGVALAFIALMLVAVISVVALSLDIGRTFYLENKLNVALDAGILRGSQTLEKGGNQAQARQAAERVIRANFADTNLSQDQINEVMSSLNFSFPDANTITVTASITHDVWLAQVVSPIRSLTVPMTVQAAHVPPQPGSTPSIVFVFDVSSSMRRDPNGDGKKKIEELEDAADHLFNNVIPPGVEVLIVLYWEGIKRLFEHEDEGGAVGTDGVKVVDATNLSQVLTAVNSLPRITSGTNIAAGQYLAWEQLKVMRAKRIAAEPDPAKHEEVVRDWKRMVVVMTDGLPTRNLSEAFAVATQTDGTAFDGEPVPLVPGGMECGSDEDEEAVEWSDVLKAFGSIYGEGTPVYTLGFGQSDVDQALLKRMAGTERDNRYTCNTTDTGPAVTSRGGFELADTEVQLTNALSNFIADSGVLGLPSHLTR